jgi:prepilin-type N-terminal cleavage/methylation domain-containing protein
MKTKIKLPIADCRLPIERPAAAFSISIVNRKSQIVNAFTLIELLVVISIIALLAAFIFPVMAVIEKNKFITRTKAEMGQVAGAIDSYKDAWGFYPPDNPGSNPLGMVNQLFYELVGTTNIPPTTFQTLDGSSTVTSGTLTTVFGGVSGFVNCSKPGADEQAKGGRNFLHEYRPGQITSYNNVTLLVASVGGPDAAYAPLLPGSTANPWRYISTNPPNNPGSYDLWVQLTISGKTYLICNWTKQVQVNNPLP